MNLMKVSQQYKIYSIKMTLSFSFFILMHMNKMLISWTLLQNIYLRLSLIFKNYLSPSILWGYGISPWGGFPLPDPPKWLQKIIEKVFPDPDKKPDNNKPDKKPDKNNNKNPDNNKPDKNPDKNPDKKPDNNKPDNNKPDSNKPDNKSKNTMHFMNYWPTNFHLSSQPSYNSIHSFHIVDYSPWPVINSISLMNLLSYLILWMKFSFSFKFIFIYFFMNLMTLMLWWRDISREGSLQGHHTYSVYTGLKMSMVLFILSEIMFFMSFFWGFFHFSLAPDWEMSNNWPPVGLNMVNPFQIPLLNTCILLSSGASVTWSHYAILQKNQNTAEMTLSLTIILGLIFTYLQFLEYNLMSFSINDSSFGSSFFMTTGFHGTHVIIGTIFLFTSFIRIYLNMISNKHHFNFEASAWYWHFVDVVWIYLYTFMYWWYYFFINTN